MLSLWYLSSIVVDAECQANKADKILHAVMDLKDGTIGSLFVKGSPLLWGCCQQWQWWCFPHMLIDAVDIKKKEKPTLLMPCNSSWMKPNFVFEPPLVFPGNAWRLGVIFVVEIAKDLCRQKQEQVLFEYWLLTLRWLNSHCV